MEPSAVFALTSRTGLRWREWDDALVVFNPASGSTHRLPAGALDVLQLLAIAPASVDALLNALASLAPGRDTELKQWLGILLKELEQAGLVEQQ